MIQEQLKQEYPKTLRRLPANAKLSVAVDCWQSPNKISFMAIQGYFIDSDWRYREVLLGFEHVTDRHSGANLAKILKQALQDRYIPLQKIITVTADNAGNNGTLVQSLQEGLIEAVQLVRKELKMPTNQADLIHIPCLSHVIQLSLKALVEEMKITAKNEKVITVWKEEEEERETHTVDSDALKKKTGAPWTLKKVFVLPIVVSIY